VTGKAEPLHLDFAHDFTVLTALSTMRLNKLVLLTLKHDMLLTITITGMRTLLLQIVRAEIASSDLQIKHLSLQE
jgi:hypothetical protein